MNNTVIKLKEQVQKTLVAEAIEAIEETKKAMEALMKNQSKEELAAIERATGKINILLAMHPEEALFAGRL